MKKLNEKIALKLLQINAIKLSLQNPFMWASGIQSPIYCDNRITLSYPEIRTFIAAAFAQMSANFSFDSVSGVATAGIAHGALLADRLNVPFSYVRSKPKAHGRRNQIEGQVEPGSRVLVVEDLISTGGSSLEAVKALRDEGLKVTGVMAIFQYNFPEAEQRFASVGCPFQTLSDFRTLVALAKAHGMFDQQNLELLEKWSKDPRNWTHLAPST